MKHDESVDLRLVSRIAKIDTRMKVIQLSSNANIGIRTWGRIDYLCNFKNYRIVKSGITVGDKFEDTEVKNHNRDIKKQIKENKANNNMSKKSNKKKK